MATLTAPSRLARWWDADIAWSFRHSPVAIVSAIVLAICVLSALFAPWVAPHNPFDLATLNLTDALTPPHGMEGAKPEYLLGTDDQGRDVLSAIMFGTRISLLVALLAVVLSVALGVSLGLASGYAGGRTDAFIMRAADVQLSFPAILIALLIDGVACAVLPRSVQSDIVAVFVLVLAIGVSNWPQYARTVRGSTLVEKNKEYVQAARVIGVRPAAIVLKHLLPNVLSPFVVQGTVAFSQAILIEASLSYLGLSAQPPTPSWGNMLNEGRTYLETAPWISVFPGVAIMIAVLAFNLIGDGLRDLLDPRRR